MNICNECGNDYELHSTDGARCPKNQGNLIDGKLEFFATHFDDGLSEAERLKVEIAQLRDALTQANERVAVVEDKNINLEQKIEYANAGDLVTIPRELVLAMEAKLKEQAETIARLTAELAQCKHALDDEGEMCECGHPMGEHYYETDEIEKGCMHIVNNERSLYCECHKFEAAK